ncbi:hypothetical protein DFS34DRAFT_259582 [Phlyctochytrium arcticum]|nr:hypothetical protein DFS34DRAFT_259582 [Phlyctochytrium arcticum]
MSNSTTLPPCDWRISVYNCHRGDVFLIIHYLALLIDGSAVLATIITLYQRVRHLNGRLWTLGGFSSTEALLFFMCIGFTGRVATTACLILDNLSPGPMSVMWEVPWLFGVVAIPSSRYRPSAPSISLYTHS